MQVQTLEQTLFNILILGKSRFLPKKFYNIDYRWFTETSLGSSWNVVVHIERPQMVAHNIHTASFSRFRQIGPVLLDPNRQNTYLEQSNLVSFNRISSSCLIKSKVYTHWHICTSVLGSTWNITSVLQKVHIPDVIIASILLMQLQGWSGKRCIEAGALV